MSEEFVFGLLILGRAICSEPGRHVAHIGRVLGVHCALRWILIHLEADEGSPIPSLRQQIATGRARI